MLTTMLIQRVKVGTAERPYSTLVGSTELEWAKVT